MKSYTETLKELEESSHVSTPMPQYQCHKKVWALKIAAVEVIRPTIHELQGILDRGIDVDVSIAAVITPAEPSFGKFGVPHSYIGKHNPEVGGYYVVYDDGYKSYSPAKAFEEGYTRI